MKVRAALVMLAVGWSGIGWGQGPVAATGRRPMTFADLMAMKRVSDPQISPSGRWVLFSVTAASLEKNAKITDLWVVPMAGAPGQQPGGERQLTSGDVSQTGGRFSPDGKWVLLLSSGGGSTQIWTAAWDDATGTMARAHPLTNVATEVDGAVWSPDSKRILFTSSVYPSCSDDATWAEQNACNRTRLDAEAKDPVKAQLWDHLLYRHWDHFTGERRSHVLVVDFADGEHVRDLTPRSVVGEAETPTFSLGGPAGYAWAPDSHEIAYVTNLDKVPAASTNNDVFTLRLDDPAAHAVKVSTSPGSDDAPAYSPDGRYLAFRSQARAGYESDRFRLMLFDRARGTTKEMMRVAVPAKPGMPGAPAFDLWIDEFTWSPNSKLLYFVSAEKGEAPVFRINLEGNDFHRLGRIHGEWSSIAVDPKTYNIVGTLMTVTRPAEIAVGLQDEMDDTERSMAIALDGSAPNVDTTRQEYQARRLTHSNDHLLESLDLSGMESFWFSGAENTRVQGFLIRPPNFDPSKRYPVKFLIHGGPQGAWGDAWSYRWNAELFAASGYAVVMINPRGSTGYGQAFIDGVNGDWGGKPYVDLMRGLDAAEARFPFLDKTRECALGASYGGFMANWILTHNQRFRCIVTHDGMYNPAAVYGTTDELWFNEWEFRRPGTTEPGQPWRYAAGPLADDPFRKWSPMLSIQNARTPTLVIHSQRDYRLDVSEGLQLFTALQRLGVPSEMLYFPDEGHWILKPRNSELWYKTVNDWCDRWTHTNAYAEAH